MSLRDEIIEVLDEVERLIKEIEQGRMDRQEIIRRLKLIYSDLEELYRSD